MDYKPGTPLTDIQTDDPVEFITRLDPDELPQLNARWFIEFWGDGKTTPRVRSFGHKGDKTSAHFIAVRGGIPWHTDPGFVRYSLHLELYNGGWWTHGTDANQDGKQLFTPGLVTVLDTWSPHRVSRDPRLPLTSPSKLAAAIDFLDYPPVAEALAVLFEHVSTLEIPD